MQDIQSYLIVIEARATSSRTATCKDKDMTLKQTSFLIYPAKQRRNVLHMHIYYILICGKWPSKGISVPFQVLKTDYLRRLCLLGSKRGGLEGGMGVKDEVIGVCNVIGREEKGKGSKRCCPTPPCPQNSSTQTMFVSF